MAAVPKRVVQPHCANLHRSSSPWRSSSHAGAPVLQVGSCKAPPLRVAPTPGGAVVGRGDHCNCTALVEAVIPVLLLLFFCCCMFSIFRPHAVPPFFKIKLRSYLQNALKTLDSTPKWVSNSLHPKSRARCPIAGCAGRCGAERTAQGRSHPNLKETSRIPKGNPKPSTLNLETSALTLQTSTVDPQP